MASWDRIINLGGSYASKIARWTSSKPLFLLDSYNATIITGWAPLIARMSYFQTF